MSDMLMIYIFISFLIGVKYFTYWYKILQPDSMRYAPKYKRVILYVAVILLSGALWPLSLYDLTIYNNKKRKGK